MAAGVPKSATLAAAKAAAVSDQGDPGQWMDTQ
jgi:hypothetical protein